jgi:hypothetical protein
MSTMAEICAAIAAIGKTVSGIVNASDPPPEQLDSASMPALYVFTGGAEYDGDPDGFTPETRQYRVRVAVAPLGQTTPPVIEARVRTLLPLVRAAFIAAPTLNRSVLQSTPLGDSGVVQLPEYGAVGFELRLAVLDIH